MPVNLRGKPIQATAILLGIIALISIICFLSFYLWASNLDSSLSRLFLSDSRVPVHITVFGRSSDTNEANTISARIDFFTSSGESLGNVERSWAGWELKIDCIVIGAKKGYLAFPFLAYTDETKRGSGVDLLRSYDRFGFPAIYESGKLTKDERNSLKRLFGLVGTEKWVPGILGSLRHETVSIRSFEAGKEYSLFISHDGALSLRGN